MPSTSATVPPRGRASGSPGFRLEGSNCATSAIPPHPEPRNHGRSGHLNCNASSSHAKIVLYPTNSLYKFGKIGLNRRDTTSIGTGNPKEPEEEKDAHASARE